MIFVGITFLAGRYHATPWRRHVNEGAVEWPPGPWRFCRALISTGYRKLGWSEVPAAMIELVEALGTRVPAYHLPRGTAAHTRHYMPIKGSKTTKVLDTFIHLGEGAQLVMAWDVELSPGATALLDELLANLGYLGRAESWIEARRMESLELDGQVPCSTITDDPDAHPVRVLLLEEPARYARWREQAVADEETRVLEQKRAAAREKGRAEPKKLGKRDLEKIEGAFPRNTIEVLETDTGTLQGQGWSQPPGTGWATIWRPEAAMRIGGSATGADLAPGPPFMLLEVRPDTRSGAGFPPLQDALRRAEGFHRKLVAIAAKQAGGTRSPCLAGQRDGQPLQGHTHLHVLPLCLDGRGGREVIDHILLWIPGGGFDLQRQRAVLSTATLEAHNLPPAALTCVGTGEADLFEQLVPAVGTGTVWQSAAPFVPPRFLKNGGRNTLLNQVQAELRSRGLPGATRVEIEVIGAGGQPEWIDAATWSPRSPVRRSLRFRHFRIERDKEGRAPKQRLAFTLRLHFGEPIQGPITLGYASHFGLGLFSPQR
jgi:CRISPR-associated protein Csb2